MSVWHLSVFLSGSAEVCEPHAKWRVDVQGEWKHISPWLYQSKSPDWIRAVPNICFHLWISSPALSFFSNCPTGGEHSDHRSVLRGFLFLPFPFCLLISSTLLLQRWILAPHLPLPAMVGQHTSITWTQMESTLTPFCAAASSLPQVLLPQDQTTRVWDTKQESQNSLKRREKNPIFLIYEHQKSAIEHFTNWVFYWKWSNHFVQLYKQLQAYQILMESNIKLKTPKTNQSICCRLVFGVKPPSLWPH